MEDVEVRPSLNSALLGQQNGEDGDGKIKRTEIVEEVKKQLWLAGPLISVSLLQYCLQMISVMFVGHLGELSLAGAAMGTSFATVTGFSFLLGIASALDTFCGQSYGARQYHMLGIHMQRAMFVVVILGIPLAIIWANTTPILIACGQDKAISMVAGSYATVMIPSLFAYGLLQCLNKFLQNQNNVFPMMICSAITLSLHILVCWILVFKSGLHTNGAAVANNISYWINFTLLALYVKFSPSCANTWKGLSKEALHDVLDFLKLGIPSAVMVCFEMWLYEMIVLMSGLLPNPQLETSVLSVCLNTAATVWMVPYGLGGSVSTRVSNELGAGHPNLARLAVYIAVSMAVIEGLLVGSVLIGIRNIWGYAYSNDIEVINYVAVILPFVAVANFMDGLQCVLSGVARGCGWQKIGAFINLGSYYFIGIPTAIVLAFVFHFGGKGLYLGILAALVVQVLSFVILTARSNWELEAKKATQRVYDALHLES